MPLQSMTGFAREAGTHGIWRWTWEIRSVNGRGLEVKFKLPPGFEALTEPLRRDAAAKLQRGSVFAALSAQPDAANAKPKIDEALLDALVEAAKRAAARHGLAPPAIANLLALRGVVEAAEAAESEDEREASLAAFQAGFARALEAVVHMRAEEGSRLEAVLGGKLDEIGRLTEAADACPARQPEAVRRGSRSRCATSWEPRRASMPSACIRRPSSSPAEPMCARRSIGCGRILPPRASS